MPIPTLNKILYAEDETDIQVIVKMTLEAAGFTLEACASGQELLQKAPSFNPDLILLDVMMPGMDGLSTFKELRKIPPTAKTPIIFMTAKIQKNEMEEYKKLGVLDVITKPFDPLTLSSTLKKTWQDYHFSLLKKE